MRAIAADRFAIIKRFVILLTGFLGNTVIVTVFDWMIYPSVLAKYGLVSGGAIMWLLSFVVCYVSIIGYDLARIDWLGIEAMKASGEFGEGWISRIIRFISGDSEKGLFFFLSIKYDPFITLIAMRKGAYEFDGLSNSRSRRIFFGSFMIGNLYWTLAMFMGVSMGDIFLSFLCNHFPVICEYVSLVTGPISSAMDWIQSGIVEVLSKAWMLFF